MDELLADLTQPLDPAPLYAALSQVDFATFRLHSDERFTRVWKSLVHSAERLDKLDPACQTWSQYLLERCFNTDITEYGIFAAWFYAYSWSGNQIRITPALYKFAIAATTTANRYLGAHMSEHNEAGLSAHIQKFNPTLHAYFCFGCPDDQKRDSQYLIAMIVFLCDGLLAITGVAPSSMARRFFHIAQQLPLELQQVLANYAYGLTAPERGGFNNLPKNDIRWRRMLRALAL